MRRWCSKLIAAENGAMAIEYALIAALIAVVLLSAILSLGASLQGTFDFIAQVTSNANNGP